MKYKLGQKVMIIKITDCSVDFYKDSIGNIGIIVSFPENEKYIAEVETDNHTLFVKDCEIRPLTQEEESIEEQAEALMEEVKENKEEAISKGIYPIEKQEQPQPKFKVGDSVKLSEKYMTKILEIDSDNRFYNHYKNKVFKILRIEDDMAVIDFPSAFGGGENWWDLDKLELYQPPKERKKLEYTYNNERNALFERLKTGDKELERNLGIYARNIQRLKKEYYDKIKFLEEIYKQNLQDLEKEILFKCEITLQNAKILNEIFKKYGVD